MAERRLVVEWEDPSRPREARNSMDIFAYARAMASGELPRAPVQALLGSRLVDVTDGVAVMELDCGEQHANPFGTVHGAIFGHLVDAAGGFAIASRLPADARSISVDLRTSFLRPVPADGGTIRCTAKAVHVGGRMAIAEGEVIDTGDRLCAYGTVMYLVLRG